MLTVGLPLMQFVFGCPDAFHLDCRVVGGGEWLGNIRKKSFSFSILPMGGIAVSTRPPLTRPPVSSADQFTSLSSATPGENFLEAKAPQDTVVLNLF